MPILQSVTTVNMDISVKANLSELHKVPNTIDKNDRFIAIARVFQIFVFMTSNLTKEAG